MCRSPPLGISTRKALSSIGLFFAASKALMARCSCEVAIVRAGLGGVWAWANAARQRKSAAVRRGVGRFIRRPLIKRCYGARITRREGVRENGSGWVYLICGGA